MNFRDFLRFPVDLIRTRIAARVTIAVSLVVVIMSGFFGTLVIHSYQRCALRQTEQNAQLISETIKSATRHAMMLNQSSHVNEIIAEIDRQPGIGDIRLFNKDGVVVYSPNSAALGTVADKSSDVCRNCHSGVDPIQHLTMPQQTRVFDTPDGETYLGVINPVYNAPSCSTTDCHPPVSEQAVLGVLDVTFSLEKSKANLQTNLEKAGVLLVGAIIGIAFVIWLSLRYLVRRPVNYLLRATEAVSHGDLTYRLEGQHRDEIGRLAESFNEMTQSLQDAKAQILRSNKLASLGRLAAGVAHEINNPLTGVLSFSSLLLKNAPEGTDEHEDLETIVRETKRCRTIVRGLLDFSRQVQPRKTRACFNTAVRRALEIVKNQLLVNKASVNMDLEEELPEVLADSEQLVQLVLNLVVNASDAMAGQSDAVINVKTRLIRAEGQDVAEVTVCDNGPGIPADIIEKVFDPFFSTKGNLGTGLGLSVVWGIVDEHGGTITVDSPPGAGACFTIRMPIYDAAAVAEKEPES